MITTENILDSNSYIPGDFYCDDLTIIIKQVDSQIIIDWIGKSGGRDLEEKLSVYFDKLIKYLKNREVVVDFTKLEYMNMSAISPVIYFLTKLGLNNIKSVFYYKKSLEWQQLSFGAFEVISRNIKNISIEGR